MPTVATLANVSLQTESANVNPPQHKVHVSTQKEKVGKEFYLVKPSGNETDVRGKPGSTSAQHLLNNIIKV